MSHEAQATVQEEVAAQAPVEAPKALPLIMQFKMQLDGYKVQRDNAKAQFEQLNGAVFVCEQMINQYESELKQTVVTLAKGLAKPVVSLTPTENLGEINDGQVNDESAKQVAQE